MGKTDLLQYIKHFAVNPNRCIKYDPSHSSSKEKKYGIVKKNNNNNNETS